MLTAPRAAVER